MLSVLSGAFLDGRAAVYRLVTSVFSMAGPISLIFGLMSFNQVGPRLERSLGESPEHYDVLLFLPVHRAVGRENSRYTLRSHKMS